jgi:ankyrin repeat protein
LYEKTDVLNLIFSQNGLNEIDADGKTPISWAIHKGDLEVVKALIKSGVDVNTYCIYRLNGKGKTETPLEMSVADALGGSNQEEIVKIVEYLLEEGAEMTEAIKKKVNSNSYLSSQGSENQKLIKGLFQIYKIENIT